MHYPDLSVARDLVRNGCFEAVEFLYDSIPDTLREVDSAVLQAVKEGSLCNISACSSITPQAFYLLVCRQAEVLMTVIKCKKTAVKFCGFMTAAKYFMLHSKNKRRGVTAMQGKYWMHIRNDRKRIKLRRSSWKISY